tara:strand:+ start:406 stop:660 length:255 start_codon:yes stop_codon:yes gene_type:complete
MKKGSKDKVCSFPSACPQQIFKGDENIKHLLDFREDFGMSTLQRLGAQTPNHHQISDISSQNGCEKNSKRAFIPMILNYKQKSA